MTHYNTLKVKLSDSQLNKLKSRITNGTQVNLKLLSNLAGDCNDETGFPRKLFLTNTQVSSLRKAFASGLSSNIKLSKSELCNIGQSGGFLVRLLDSLLKTGLSLIKNILKPLAKSILIPLGLTAVASATNEPIEKKIFGSDMAALITSNEELNNIMKIFKSLEKAGLLIKCVSGTVENEAEEEKKWISQHVIKFIRC